MANQFKSIRKRTLIVSSSLVVLGVVLIARLFYIQVLNSKKYQELCNNQANLRKAVLPRRGIFYDRNGEALTIDLVNYSIAAHPYLVEDKPRLASTLANDLSAKPEQYLKLLESNKTFVWLEREVPYSSFQNYEKYEKTPG